MRPHLLTLCLLAAVSCKRPTPVAIEPAVIPIAAINDFHGALYEKTVRSDASRALGGLPWLAAAVDHLRIENPDLLLLDGGDIFQGSWPVNASRGMGAVQAFNILGVTAAAIGNHEFDYGPGTRPSSQHRRGALEEAAMTASFSWLSANISLDGEPWNPPGSTPYTIAQVRGKKVGIIGLTTQDTPQTTLLANVEDLSFEDPVEAVRNLLPVFEEQEVDATVVVGHLTGSCTPAGFADPGEPCLPDGEIGALLTELPRGTIDVMVVGHAHTLLNHRYEDTFLMENRSGGQMIGRLDLVVTDAGVDPDASVLHPPWVLGHTAVDPGCDGGAFPTTPLDVGGVSLTPSQEALRLVEALEAEAGSLCDPVGCAAMPLTRSRGSEAAAANVLADAMFAAFDDVDFAIQNSGGVRAPFPAGPLRVEHVQAVMPFDNRLLLVELTGEQVEALFRVGSSGAHGILQVSGARYHFDPDRTDQREVNDDGKLEAWETDRLCSVQVGGHELDPQKRYRVVTTDFLYGGGDHLAPVFAKAPVLETGALLRDAIVTYIRNQPSCLGEASPVIDAENPRIHVGSCTAEE